MHLENSQRQQYLNKTSIRWQQTIPRSQELVFYHITCQTEVGRGALLHTVTQGPRPIAAWNIGPSKPLLRRRRG